MSMTTSKQRKIAKRQRRTNKILNKISYELFQKPYTELGPKQMDQVVGKMLYSADLKGRSFRQVK